MPGIRAPSPTDNPYVSVGASKLDTDEAERLVYQEVNRVRREACLAELRYDEELAELVVEEWMESEGHYRNLVEENYSRQGIGVIEGEEMVYVTQKLC